MASIFSTVRRARLAVAAWVPIVFQGDVLVRLWSQVANGIGSSPVGFSSEPAVGLWRKSTVYGLNGHRLHYIISLFKVTYKSTTQVSRNFHALFTKTLENSDTCSGTRRFVFRRALRTPPSLKYRLPLPVRRPRPMRHVPEAIGRLAR
jgi:hypothetical protein